MLAFFCSRMCVCCCCCYYTVFMSNITCSVDPVFEAHFQNIDTLVQLLHEFIMHLITRERKREEKNII